jgi:hypothetical protein
MATATRRKTKRVPIRPVKTRAKRSAPKPARSAVAPRSVAPVGNGANSPSVIQRMDERRLTMPGESWNAFVWQSMATCQLLGMSMMREYARPWLALQERAGTGGERRNVDPRKQ